MLQLLFSVDAPEKRIWKDTNECILHLLYRGKMKAENNKKASTMDPALAGLGRSYATIGNIQPEKGKIIHGTQSNLMKFPISHLRLSHFPKSHRKVAYRHPLILRS